MKQKSLIQTIQRTQIECIRLAAIDMGTH